MAERSKISKDEGERIAKDGADWLLDAIAGSTQDRRFLRGDSACDQVACDAILLNGEKAIDHAIAKWAKWIYG